MTTTLSQPTRRLCEWREQEATLKRAQEEIQTLTHALSICNTELKLSTGPAAADVRRSLVYELAKYRDESKALASDLADTTSKAGNGLVFDGSPSTWTDQRTPHACVSVVTLRRHVCVMRVCVCCYPEASCVCHACVCHACVCLLLP